MLEDDFTYVLRKALKGLALPPGEAALRADLSSSEVMTLIHGKFSEPAARAIAPVLGLRATALANHPHYEPKPLTLEAITRIDIPFEDGQVNAWLIQHGGITLLFDTGYSPDSLAKALESFTAPSFDAAFITHSHHDHTGGLPEARKHAQRIYGPAHDPMPGVTPLYPGEELKIATISIVAIDLAGHCDGALGYLVTGLVTGLKQPVCVVGDALFAGSIGGCSPEHYQTALENLRKGVFTLPDDTVLLPGHGPATTVGEEKVSNPFFARL